mgnify:CR=1 FL=1
MFQRMWVSGSSCQYLGDTFPVLTGIVHMRQHVQHSRSAAHACLHFQDFPTAEFTAKVDLQITHSVDVHWLLHAVIVSKSMFRIRQAEEPAGGV